MSQPLQGQSSAFQSNKIQNMVDLFCPYHKFLVFNLVQRNLKLKYKKSVLGFLWSFISPATTALVYYVVFKHVMKVSIPNYLTFILMGILPWNFLLTCLGAGLDSLVTNHNLLNKIPLPIHALPLAECLSAIINFTFSLPVILVVALLLHVPITWGYLLIPFFLFLLFLQSFSYALLLGVGFVYFKDLRHAVSVTIQLLFYFTPILYKVEMVPESFRGFVYLNPLSMIFSSMNQIASEGIIPSPIQFLHATFATVVVFTIAYFTFKKHQYKVIESL